MGVVGGLYVVCILVSPHLHLLRIPEKVPSNFENMFCLSPKNPGKSSADVNHVFNNMIRKTSFFNNMICLRCTLLGRMLFTRKQFSRIS